MKAEQKFNLGCIKLGLARVDFPQHFKRPPPPLMHILLLLHHTNHLTNHHRIERQTVKKLTAGKLVAEMRKLVVSRDQRQSVAFQFHGLDDI